MFKEVPLLFVIDVFLRRFAYCAPLPRHTCIYRVLTSIEGVGSSRRCGNDVLPRRRAQLIGVPACVEVIDYLWLRRFFDYFRVSRCRSQNFVVLFKNFLVDFGGRFVVDM